MTDNLNKPVLLALFDEDGDILNYNVIPSSNSVMAHNLFTLGLLMVDREYLDKSASMMKQMQDRFLKYPHGFANWGSLLLKQLNPYYEIVVSGLCTLPQTVFEIDMQQ